MTSESRIIWLASYPKSGNTWFRSFLSALKNPNKFNINQLETDGIFSSKIPLETLLDIDSTWLKDEIIFQFQPLAYESKLKNSSNDLIIKIHDRIVIDHGISNLNLNCPHKAIYIIRNPFDIIPSLANHLGIGLDDSLEKLCDSNFQFIKKNQLPNIQFVQPLGSWSDHVQSWLNLYKKDIIFIKYEDMLEKPFLTFSKALEFLGWDYSKEKVQEAINLTNFKNLKKQENDLGGFNEKPANVKSFFNKGQSGYGRGLLKEEQIEKVLNRHQLTMKHFNYL